LLLINNFNINDPPDILFITTIANLNICYPYYNIPHKERKINTEEALAHATDPEYMRKMLS